MFSLRLLDFPFLIRSTVFSLGERLTADDGSMYNFEPQGMAEQKSILQDFDRYIGGLFAPEDDTLVRGRLVRSESIGGRLPIEIAWPQDRGRKLWMIRRVRVMLGFQTEAGS